MGVDIVSTADIFSTISQRFGIKDSGRQDGRVVFIYLSGILPGLNEIRADPSRRITDSVISLIVVVIRVAPKMTAWRRMSGHHLMASFS
jgi:hypothetical protein